MEILMKTIIITGANSGLGFETAKKIAADKDYKVILACRNMEKAQRAQEEIVSETGNTAVETMQLDTSSLASVRSFAQKIIDSGITVDGLINNAGISPAGNTGITDEGFELVFATNYLGHFLLTQMLLPHMASDARIINITSDMHNPPGGDLNWEGTEALAHPAEDDRRKYSYSKLCMIYLTHELDRRLREEGSSIVVNSFNPGFMADTNFSKGTGKARELVIKTTMPDRYGTLEASSDALAKVATDSEFANVSNVYFDRSTNTAQSSDLSYNSDNAAELWGKSFGYCGL